jgi:hypothetical protein
MMMICFYDYTVAAATFWFQLIAASNYSSD